MAVVVVLIETHLTGVWFCFADVPERTVSCFLYYCYMSCHTVCLKLGYRYRYIYLHYCGLKAE